MESVSKYDELVEKLENVSDSYPDFVIGVRKIAEKESICEEIIEFINSNPKADTSDISEHIFSNLVEV